MSKVIDYLFVLLASLCMIAGVALGLWMGANRDFMLAPVHAHINLLGWASLALYGVIYRTFPELGGHVAKAVHLSLSGAGAVLFPIGLAIELTRSGSALIVVASALWFLGALLFLANLLRRDAMPFRRRRAQGLGGRPSGPPR